MKKLAMVFAMFLAALFCSCTGANADTSGESVFSDLSTSSSVVSVSETEVPPRGEPAPELPEDTIKRFAAQTSSQLLAGGDNLCYSPLSLYMSVALVTMGAEGQTLDELMKFLQVPDADKATLEGSVSIWMDSLPFSFEAIDDEITSATPRILSIANSAWVDDKFAIDETFRTLAENSFQADVFGANFTYGTTNGQISNWISEQTGGQLQPNINNAEETAMCLVNTLRLEDRWHGTFNENLNTEELFQRADGSAENVTFMNKIMEEHPYINGDGFIGVAVDLTGNIDVDTWGPPTGRMVLVLPDKDIPAADFVADEDLLYTALVAEEHGDPDVILKLPKFTFDSKIEPIDAMQELGVLAAFDNGRAEFPAMLSDDSGDIPLFISDIIQETHIAIDEDGVEASAYTKTSIAPLSAISPPEEEPEEIEIFLDRPFLFYIEYDGVPLFVGIVKNPTA